jgi:hypothetical protein
MLPELDCSVFEYATSPGKSSSFIVPRLIAPAPRNPFTKTPPA